MLWSCTLPIQMSPTSTNLCAKAIIESGSKFWVPRAHEMSKKTQKWLRNSKVSLGKPHQSEWPQSQPICEQRSESNWHWNSECQGHKKFENWARNGREIPRLVWDDLAAPSDLDLNKPPRKGHNQFSLEILSAKDTKSVKIGPEMAEKSQDQCGTTSRLRVTLTSTNLRVKGIISLSSKFWVPRTQKVWKLGQKRPRNPKVSLGRPHGAEWPRPQPISALRA